MMLTILLLFFPLQSIYSTNPDDSLPVYMRGLNWNKVEEVLKEDLRLPDAVNPINYAIELSVNVRDHKGAQLSNFKGTVTIELEFTKSTDRIELHSNGLNIEKVDILEFVVMESSPTITKFSINQERETILVHLNRTVNKGEEFLLQITYTGVAIMNEYGLYENWDPKFNKTLDTNGAFVLATNNFPTGARFWFPCFDEPQRKATFELRVNHPKGLNVYSNTEIERTEQDSNSIRITTVFAKSHMLSTYQLTLSVNHFPVENLGQLQGYKRARVISSLNNPEGKLKEIERDMINFNLEHLKNSTLQDHFNGNLDIIILDGTHIFTVNPGLIIFGRYNYFADFERNRMYPKIPIPPISNFTNLIVGNQLSVLSIDQIWINDMFGMFYAKEPYYSASQLMKVIDRMCPAAKTAFEDYLILYRGKKAHIDVFVYIVSQACKSDDIRDILNDFIEQPGRAFLTVTRLNNTVEIRQSRYLSTSFNEKLRDTTTRYTIPIFVNVDGKESIKILRKNETSLKFSLEQNSTFYIDYQYDRLYFVFYKDFLHYKNVTKDKQIELQLMHRKSLIAALEQSAITYDEFVEHAMHYVNQSVFLMSNVITLFGEDALSTFVLNFRYTAPESYLTSYCQSDKLDYSMNWDELFNNDTSRYWHYQWNLAWNSSLIYLSNDRNMVMKISCLKEWHNSTTYLQFLEKNFFGDSTQIRPSLVKSLVERVGNEDNSQWKELHQFFFNNAHNFTDP